jgi:hypothetical protein
MVQRFDTEHDLFRDQVLAKMRRHPHAERIPTLSPAGGIIAAFVQRGSGDDARRMFGI